MVKVQKGDIALEGPMSVIASELLLIINFLQNDLEVDPAKLLKEATEAQTPEEAPESAKMLLALMLQLVNKDDAINKG